MDCVFNPLSLQICIAIFSGKERPLAGTMVALACTYLTYALMPIRLKDALLAGTILAVSDVVLLVTVGQFDLWSHQVRQDKCLLSIKYPHTDVLGLVFPFSLGKSDGDKCKTHPKFSVISHVHFKWKSLGWGGGDLCYLYKYMSHVSLETIALRIMKAKRATHFLLISEQFLCSSLFTLWTISHFR